MVLGSGPPPLEYGVLIRSATVGICTSLHTMETRKKAQGGLRTVKLEEKGLLGEVQLEVGDQGKKLQPPIDMEPHASHMPQDFLVLVDEILPFQEGRPTTDGDQYRGDIRKESLALPKKDRDAVEVPTLTNSSLASHISSLDNFLDQQIKELAEARNRATWKRRARDKSYTMAALVHSNIKPMWL